MSARLDVVDLIMQDHREVERLFEQMQADPDKRPLFLPVVTALLIAHSRAEELHVYPAARDEADEHDEVAHSQEEHQEAEQVLTQLQELETDSSKFEQLFNQLVEDVNHHVEEEEQTVLPGMRERLSDQRRHELGKAFLQERSKHLGGQPGQATREELAQQAQNVGVTGTSSMTKDEIAAKLDNQ
ncbi:hemerythrin domain-containing protein [Phytoactinopolyspora mesophila]|uniref:Hemerythrin domain-containing protein n=1 Tax=Phytoactinopolyspora mesophila TaxID=2650750 RepID=A0A7K3LXM3_9ACTN|nr:hemerythrin domain-containing protein [Phytoactinopolyspora mesophila]NDL55720.1 hemerythrin domain-containing protein [Phytoactinopolyspora mesophila]